MNPTANKALFVILAATLGAAVLWSIGQASRSAPKFATWESLELDAQASVWLIERVVAPGTRVEFRRSGRSLDDRVAIAVPGTALGRGQGLSAFEKLVAHYEVTDPHALQLAGVVNKIEVSAWSSVADPQADTIEQSYRWLQQRYNHNVPVDCYRAFFDVVAEQMTAPDLSLLPVKIAYLSEQDAACISPVGLEPETHQVLLVPVDDVLAHIDAGQKVVFLDVREASEFAESHIPGAMNLTLRDIDDQHVSQFRDADLIIPYCIKDFRGFEAARKLARLGLTQVGTLQPHGLAGWRSLDLPVTGGNISEVQALSALRMRAESG